MLAELLEHDHGQQAWAGPASCNGMEWRLRAWLIFSQSRQLNFSRTVSTTYHWRGTDSSVRVRSSPSLRKRLPPQRSHAVGDHHALAGKMIGDRIAFAARAGKSAHRCRPGDGSYGRKLVFLRDVFQAQLGRLVPREGGLVSRNGRCL
jgi:hypothetical protein